MSRTVVLKEDIVRALREAGVSRGQALMVHTALSRLGYVVGGAQTVIEALIACVGEEGTLVMPTQSWKNLDPEEGVHGDVLRERWPAIRENWPAYDKALTPTNTMGAVAEMFRRWPGAVRSDHPARSVAAWGRHAQAVTQNHDLSDIFGESSPLARLYDLDARVLLLGVGYDKNTSLHLADVRATYPGKHNVMQGSAMMVDGRREWVRYETLYVDGEDFEEIGAAFEQTGGAAVCPLGDAQIRLMRQRELVDFAVRYIEAHRTSSNRREDRDV